MSEQQKSHVWSLFVHYGLMCSYWHHFESVFDLGYRPSISCVPTFKYTSRKTTDGTGTGGDIRSGGCSVPSALALTPQLDEQGA